MVGLLRAGVRVRPCIFRPQATGIRTALRKERNTGTIDGGPLKRSVKPREVSLGTKDDAALMGAIESSMKEDANEEEDDEEDEEEAKEESAKSRGALALTLTKQSRGTTATFNFGLYQCNMLNCLLVC